MRCRVLASGSKGNCYLLEGEKETLIIECGIKISEIKKGLGFDLSSVCGCLVTHEHKDHSKSVADMLALGIDIYASKGTFEALGISRYNTKAIEPLKQFKAGGFTVLPFPVQHDAREPMGFLIEHKEMGKLVFLTDTYYCKYKFKGVNHFLVEANYKAEYITDEAIRKRLYESHMEIENTLEFLRANISEDARTITLIHLSSQNADQGEFESMVKKETGMICNIANAGLIVELEKGET